MQQKHKHLCALMWSIHRKIRKILLIPNQLRRVPVSPSRLGFRMFFGKFRNNDSPYFWSSTLHLILDEFANRKTDAFLTPCRTVGRRESFSKTDALAIGPGGCVQVVPVASLQTDTNRRTAATSPMAGMCMSVLSVYLP
jgi:hypothetical protein